MGNKFKLSDMIPNAWFHKLKYINKTSKNKHHLSPPPAPPSSPPQPEPECHSRKSYHIRRELTIDLTKSPPKKSKSSSKSRRSTRRSSSISSFSCQSTSTSLSYGSKSRSPPSPPQETDVTKVVSNNLSNVGFLVEDALLKYRASCIANKQSILNQNALADNKLGHFDGNALTADSLMQPEHFQLRPIVTTKQKSTAKVQKQNSQNTPPSRRLSISSQGRVRLKINSPRFIPKKQGQTGHKNTGRKTASSKKRRSISESFAIVKSSFNPQRDFEESMVEMIVQNNLTAPKDLEDLLTCYLSLNSDEYHDIIIKVFKQIWVDFKHRDN